MAAGTRIDAGTGSVAIDLTSGFGKTYTSSGGLTVQGISAGWLSISNEGTTADSDIDLAGPLNAGPGDVTLVAVMGSILAAAAGGEIATTGTVTLDATGSIGTATNRIPFDAASSPTSVFIGVIHEPASIYLDGRGNLTLDDILGGAANTSVDVTARGNLTVATNGAIDSGNGTISLGADLNADGTGDDGVGTLSIAPGAEVLASNVGTNAITLRGADLNLQGSVHSGGGVAIRSSVESLPMSIGGTDNAVDGINLTDAELANIVTSSTGTIIFGDAGQKGDLTFVTATTATTPGASTVVLQSTDGPGMILLDERFISQAINTNGGSLSLTAGISGIHVIEPAHNVHEIVSTTAPASQTAAEGVSTSFSLGSFADAGTTDGPWTVTVNWGDGTASSTFDEESQGMIAPQSHTYAAGTYTATVTVSNSCGLVSNTASFQVQVSDPAVTLESVPSFLAVETFATGLEEVGRFIDPGNPTGLIHSASAYSVNVDWGDGSHTIVSSPANIAYMGEDAAGNGIFSVLASHVYPEGPITSYPITLTVTHGSSVSALTAHASVTEPAITGLTVNAPSNVVEGTATPANFAIAAFTDPAGGEPVSGYVATINWGDGSPAVAATVVSDGGGSFHVNAPAHTYTAASAATTITVAVQHDQLAAVSATAMLTVADQIPTAQLTVQKTSSPDRKVGFMVSATQTIAAESAAGYTYTINFGDGSAAQVIKRTPGNGNGVSFSHTFPSSGMFTVTATATDINGGVSAAVSVTVFSQSSKKTAQPDGVTVAMVSLANGVLTVKGLAAASETIAFQPAGGNGVQVLVDGISLGSYVGPGGKALSRIVAIGAAQNETITVDPAITVPAELYGGPLNNTLTAGGGPTIEVGGAGSNTLTGGSGRDLLVGGAGSATLDGRGNDDILIAGTILPRGTFAQRQKALEQALASWTNSAAYSARVTKVISELASLIRSHTGTDELTGDDGMDLFFANLSLPSTDWLKDLQGNDKVLNLAGKAP